MFYESRLRQRSYHQAVGLHNYQKKIIYLNVLGEILYIDWTGKEKGNCERRFTWIANFLFTSICCYFLKILNIFLYLFCPTVVEVLT
jgi:hypothetical protein